MRFGSSPEKTLTDHRNAFIRHWFQLGYVEFHHHFCRGGRYEEPCTNRWHALQKYDHAFTEQWLSNERTQRGPKSSAADVHPAEATVKFGSAGPRVTLPSGSPYLTCTISNETAALQGGLPDPDDRLQLSAPLHRSGRPSWPAPSLVPRTIYARLQWASQILNETGGMAASTLLEGFKWLAQLPVRRAVRRTLWRMADELQPVANYDYDMQYFKRQEGKERTWVVDTLPEWVTWDVNRSYLESQEEVDGLADFLEARAWSFQHEGKTRFAGVQMAWTIALAMTLYLRALRQAEEVAVCPPSRWSLSGGPGWQKRASEYHFKLDGESLRTVIYTFRCYLEDQVLSLPVNGLPPSLLYCCHSNRESYLAELVQDHPALQKLFSLVRAMVRRFFSTLVRRHLRYV